MGTSAKKYILWVLVDLVKLCILSDKVCAFLTAKNKIGSKVLWKSVYYKRSTTELIAQLACKGTQFKTTNNFDHSAIDSYNKDSILRPES